MPFNIKEWLDGHVVPLIQDQPIKIYSFIWKGSPLSDVLVWLLAGRKTNPSCTRCHIVKSLEIKGLDCAYTGCKYDDPLNKAAWGQAIKTLLTEKGFGFDFTRESMIVRMSNGVNTPIFGGDGAPIYNQAGMAAVRLFKKEEDGTNLILQLGCQYDSGEDAAQATKDFYQLMEVNPLELASKYGAAWGQA